MSIVLLATALFLVLMGIGFGMLFAKLLAHRTTLPASEDWEDVCSPGRYKAMERLLEQTDYQYLAAKSGDNNKLQKRLRDRRVRIFSSYLNCLSQDFTRICNAIKKIMVDSQVDRPDLAGLLMKQHFIFSLTVLSIEIRLVLYNFGWGTPDGRSLVRSLDNMSAHLRTLLLVVDTA